MLIKIGHDTYINPESVEAVQKNTIYTKLYDSVEEKMIEEVIIYTHGGGRFYYDGTLEQCIKQLKEAGNDS